MAGPANASLPGAGASAESPVVPQMVLLDWVFPGFSIFAGFVYKYLHIDLNLYIPLILLVGGLTVTFSYSSAYFWEQVEAYFMSAVDIRTDDEIYNILMAWVAAQKFAQSSRRFVVNTNLGSRSWFVMWSDRDDDHDDDDDGAEGPRGSDSSTKKKKALNYTPSFGSHYFWYRGRLLMFRREANREGSRNMLASEKEEISISCFGRNPWILKELLHEARTLYMAKDQNKTLIYRGALRSGSTEPYWQRCMARATRPFSTVILNEKTKADLITDVTDYLQPATQRWYSNRGIPYRRGYLLYGPPGTGKSSLSLALAGFFNMRIYIVSLSSMTASEENLGQLFNELPRRCVVLLEDIDSAGLTHTRADGGGGGGGENNGPEPLEPGQISPGTKEGEKNGRLSLSGLLNILDGVASQEGRVLIMTTNHLEKLDKALIRPGRVDMMVEFGLADTEMTAAIFRAIFAHLEGDEDVPPPPPPGPDGHLAAKQRQALEEERGQKRAAEDAHIDALALEFAARVPALEFSPAELQGHLMRHKRSPQAAIDAAEAFVQQTRKDHRNKEIQAAEDRRKAEEKRKEEQAKADKKAARKAAKKKSKASEKSSGAGSGSDAESSSSSPASNESGSEAEAGEKENEKKKTRKKKQPAKEEEEEEKAAAAPATPPKSPEPPTTTAMASVETEQADKHAKDSGYGTPASTEA
jgi:chaperone BCS1